MKYLWLCLALISASLIAARAADDTVGKILAPGTRKPAPDIAPASDEAQQAIARMKAPAGLKISLWAAEPMLANPVAFNFDERGRIFVAETYRYRSSTLDIRDYRKLLLEDELASRSLDDFSAMINRRFDPQSVKELGIEGEVVRLLEDRDHDGVADHSTVYADGFNTVLDGIASGVLARRGKVWFTNIPSLWRFTGEEKAETRTELSRGYGLRFNYTGHDLHGLIFGPDGKIYFSVGDRGAHATGPDGSLADSPDNGAVFRCNPDGTGLEVYASGLRNPESLLFTENGDLFTGDNDSDQGDEERLVQVVEGGDSGWRIGYQYSPLGRGGPWNTEKLWQPRQDGQPAYLLPPICNIEDGPSGIAYYPGTGLNASYAGTMFIAHFNGSIARSGIYTYKVAPNGATYLPSDSQPFLTSALPTDVKFGPDGRLYISDWSDGWLKSAKGRIYAISDPAHVDDALVKQTQALIASDWISKSPAELGNLLSHPDWRVRLEAQFTLAERGASSASTFSAIAANPAADPLGRRHAIWGLGQLAVQIPAALAPLRPLLRDADSEVRAQAAKMLGDHGAVDSADALIAALRDGNNRVKFFAAQSLGKLHDAAAAPALLEALRANDDKDNYLRHALVMGLVGGGNNAALTGAVQDPSRAVRIGVLLALRRMGSPEVVRFLADHDPYVVREAALAINDAPIAAGYPALAALLANSAGDEEIALRAINAHFRLGRPENAAALVQFAARKDVPANLRTEALVQLGNWPAPPARDRVVGIFRPLPEPTRDPAVVREALAPAVSGLLDPSAPPEVQSAALAIVEQVKIAAAADTLIRMVGDEKQSIPSRVSALKTLDAINDPRLAGVVATAAGSGDSRLRLAALPMIARIDPARTAPALEAAVAGASGPELQSAFDVLGAIDHPAADAIIARELKRLAANQVEPSAQLELLEAAAKHDDPAVKQLLADRDRTLAAAGNPLAEFAPTLNGGDAARGKTLFETLPTLACVRCHRVGPGTGSEVGPNLAEVGARASRDELLESIIRPNARFAAGFENAVVTRTSGTRVSGVVTAESATAISVKTNDGQTVEVPKSDIAKRAAAPSAMPEIYAASLTKRELRDIIEYLTTLRPPLSRNRGPASPEAAAAADATAAAARAANAAAGDSAGGTDIAAPVLRALRKPATAIPSP